ncbi:peptidoglycan DD-metalloendopeptidase family protein [Sagittula stellata]|uniref:LysM domain/M23/M37 peptidase n=1 Tax=Sagittula stellata (strain ATCC 700073 / DSM 11524 / E-37) TaxID=388399 RepID=A3JZ06_SAGS3|nr:peptidoglycan DD-metalloendopeptidase family protein [Sagittula stellata]EBA09709.1 LysM domain/M23/M37 peptidase [Sagittula stellata E-37]
MTLTRTLPAFALLAFGAACSNGMDVDMRGRIGGPVDTAAAAATATAERPAADNRGVISYPSYQVAVARRNDTVAQVAERIGLPAQELARYNGLQTGDTLRRGEIIALPSRVAEPSPATGGLQPAGQVDVTTLAGAAIERASPTTPRGTTSGGGAEPIRHQVARGETAFTIARLYQVSPRSLAEWNALDKDFTVREGQYLLIPVVDINEAAAASTTVPGSGTPTPTPPSSTTPLPSVDVTPIEPAAPASGGTSTAAAPAPKPPAADIGQQAAKPASSSAQMVMPVSGSIIREYSKGKNEGIDISASAGQPVKAAAAGSVASISNTTEGVKLLLIRHPGDLITVYTHVDDISVKKGDAVSKGQTIARVGSGSPSFLHFEVRKGFDSTDPMAYLK